MFRQLSSPIAVCLCALLLSGGCSGRPARVAAVALDPEAAADRALAMHDKNGDGAIDADEQRACPGLAAALAIDANNDGRIDRQEIAARLRVYEESRVGLIGGMACKITQRGAPVSDADVRLVPEAFLEADIEIATGRTNADGLAGFKIEGMQHKGIRPGLYRVEVSKKDASGAELIPADFNVETRLGMEANTSDSSEPKFRYEFALDPLPKNAKKGGG